MTTQTRIKDLFTLPDSIARIRYVTELAEALRQPEETARTYVVTKPLADSFGKALKLVATSLKGGRSQASYLHGSFGSGKSHFMALLCLLLRGDEHAWRIPELHPLRDANAGLIGKKLLEMEFHLIGEESLEEAIFSRYVDLVRTEHPKAPTPVLFADEALFANARQHLEALGEEAFFKPLNDLEGGSSAGWGALATAWNRARFEELATSMHPKQRGELVNALTRTWFKSFLETPRKYIDLDDGLGIVSEHARGLGYDGIIFFLDEVILWLASRASNLTWFHNEVQKLVKLVEGQSQHVIPFVSFLARQRDLSEMVGERFAGAENAQLRESLKWSEGRFETITLEDRNLPAIAEKRVLIPRSESARATLDEAFKRLPQQLGQATWETLLGGSAPAEFRRLYPFSPTLVDALVALSNSLQRERTAIKLLSEILVEHIEDLELGDVVGVGDLFDVVAGGEDAPNDVMRSRFESAKELYRGQLLPRIQEKNGTASAERCQRERDDAVRLGCSNCRERACRADNRLVKTLLVASLVPEVKSLKDLTVSRLVQLNHGSLRVPIAGTEARLAAGRLQEYATRVAQLHVGSQAADPAVRLELEGVDLEPILKQVEAQDTPQARQRLVKHLLFDYMGLDTDPTRGWAQEKSVEWRGTKRLGEVQFGNVRTLPESAFQVLPVHDWKLVVDYPFDEVGFGPQHDEQVIERIRDSGAGGWTIVWIPSFFSAATNRMLGDLVKLNHILESDQSARSYLMHLSVEQQIRAKSDLANLRSQKNLRIKQALEQAYGLAQAREENLDPSSVATKHLHLLRAGATLRLDLAPNLEEAVRLYVGSLLEERYPRHPHFRQRLTPGKVEDLVTIFGEIIDADDKRVACDRARLDLLRGTLGELGLVRTTETTAFLVEDKILGDLERKRVQRGYDRPEVGQLRKLADEDGYMGLMPDARDLLIRCYARWSARTFLEGTHPYEPRAAREIPEHIVLEKPDLPSAAAWAKALDRAGEVFGVTLAGRALHADNLKRFEGALGERLKALAPGASALVRALERRRSVARVAADADRLRTARSAESLLVGLTGRTGSDLVEELQAVDLVTSPRAVAQSLANALKLATTLEDPLLFTPLEQANAAFDTDEAAKAIIVELGTAYRQDEVVVPLDERIRTAVRKALDWMGRGAAGPGPASTPVAPPNPPRAGDTRLEMASRGRAEARARIEGLLALLDEYADDVRIEGTIVLRGEKKG
jgi:hypothetical protein